MTDRNNCFDQDTKRISRISKRTTICRSKKSNITISY